MTVSTFVQRLYGSSFASERYLKGSEEGYRSPGITTMPRYQHLGDIKAVVIMSAFSDDRRQHLSHDDAVLL